MAQMIPPIIAPEIKSNAERTIFRWFEELEWNNCVVLHSLGIAHHEKNIFGEIDFVVICNEGILCVEVKGGQVYRENGRWHFKNRFGQESAKNTGPFEQAQGNMHSLREQVKRRLGYYDPIRRCQYACCVMTPDCCINETGIDIIPEVLFDGEMHKSMLKEFLERSFDYWKHKCIDKHDFVGGKLEDKDIFRVLELLRGDFKLVPSLSVILNRTEEQLLTVTDEQYSIMEGCSENDRILISGSAGTGKTLLAMEQCRRLSATGKNVLFLCYNQLIASYVKAYRDKENGKYDVYDLHQIMLEECSELENSEKTSVFFNYDLPNLFIEKNKRGGISRKYDAVIIDEGQDLMNTNLFPCIKYLFRENFSEAIWSIYYDPGQNIFNQSLDFEKILSQVKRDAESNYKLTINCRNTRQIAVANKMISNMVQAKLLRTEGNEVVYKEYSGIQDEQHKLMDLIRNLKAQGISSNDIVILSPYANQSCMYNISIPNDIPEIRFKPKYDILNHEYIKFYSIKSFKGLEAKIIILVDIDKFENEDSRLQNYVGISRARTMLYIFYDKSAEGERQKMLIQGALIS